MSEIKSLYGNPIVDVGARESLDMLIDETPVYGNLVNPEDIQYNASGLTSYTSCMFLGDGKYYGNPIAQYQMWMKFYDSNGTEISVTNDSTSESVTGGIVCGWHEITINGTSVTSKEYANVSKFIEGVVRSTITYSLSETPSAIKIRFKDATNHSTSVGITYGEGKTTYVPYSASPTIEKSYSSTLMSAITNAVDNGIDSATPSIKSAVLGDINAIPDYGIKSRKIDLMEQSANILDESQIDWTAKSGYYYCVDDYYFGVVAGQTLICNVPAYVQFYDSSKTFLSYVASVGTYQPYLVPENAVYGRVYFNSSRVSQYDPVMLYYSEKPASPRDDVRQRVPDIKLKPEYVSGDIFNYAYPSDLSAEIIRMARYASVRELNRQRDAFRIGTFNLHVPRLRYGWEIIKRELYDNCIDIIGLQEVQNNEEYCLQERLKGWLYKYGSPKTYNGEIPKQAIVSAWEIVSSEMFTTNDDRTYVHSIINLPKYRNCTHQFTLSMWSIHPYPAPISEAQKRIDNFTDLLSSLGSDTADFTVIVGDTNVFKQGMDANGKLLEWEMMIEAGYNPIHYGVSTTVNNQAIDQIFIGPNIRCVNLNVVDSNDYPVVINGQSMYVSDHCLLYADLVFDFDAVYPDSTLDKRSNG